MRQHPHGDRPAVGVHAGAGRQAMRGMRVNTASAATPLCDPPPGIAGPRCHAIRLAGVMPYGLLMSCHTACWCHVLVHAPCPMPYGVPTTLTCHVPDHAALV
eukprot:261386-Chlamydomonas_euryale.AAC.7